jgi:hypothetical protein
MGDLYAFPMLDLAVKLIVNKKVLVEEKEAWALKHGIWKMQSER